jgi:hypothetical protein
MENEYPDERWTLFRQLDLGDEAWKLPIDSLNTETTTVDEKRYVASVVRRLAFLLDRAKEPRTTCSQSLTASQCRYRANRDPVANVASIREVMTD